MTNGLVSEICRKLVQFMTLFHTLKHGRLMVEYMRLPRMSLIFLNLEKKPKMYMLNKHF
jgi:hypothetical protein